MKCDMTFDADVYRTIRKGIQVVFFLFLFYIIIFSYK